MQIRSIRLPLICLAVGFVGFCAAAGRAQEAPETSSPTDDTDLETPEVRFTCQVNNGQYTVMYRPESQPEQAYPWAVPGDLGSAWPAERRCQEISRRLELYRPDGLLELQTAVENGYNTVCVTTEAVPACRIVFTVPPGQDPVVTRNRVFENLTLADSGTATEGVNTFVGGERPAGALTEILGGGISGSRSSGINLKPFLDAADGGTGTRLTGGGSSGSRSLDPDSFR